VGFLVPLFPLSVEGVGSPWLLVATGMFEIYRILYAQLTLDSFGIDRPLNRIQALHQHAEDILSICSFCADLVMNRVQVSGV
jgi:hypothetical protein